MKKRSAEVRRRRVRLFFRILLSGFIIGLLIGLLAGVFWEIKISQYSSNQTDPATKESHQTEAVDGLQTVSPTVSPDTSSKVSTAVSITQVPSPTQELVPKIEKIYWDNTWQYADFPKIHDDIVILYQSDAQIRKNHVIAVNAGHGTPGGSNERTQCHPDGSAKVTGGSTAAGEIYATAISGGTTFLDGTEEAAARLSLAELLKEKLLDGGYDVLMIRETNNCQIDNIARTVYANENADCHISLHYDSSETDKGFFYISVPENVTYRSMEPVASHWTEHEKLGESILEGVKTHGIQIFGSGSVEIDLTQTSYSTIPSVDVEVGDRASDYTQETQEKIASGILSGIQLFFE